MIGFWVGSAAATPMPIDRAERHHPDHAASAPLSCCPRRQRHHPVQLCQAHSVLTLLQTPKYLTTFVPTCQPPRSLSLRLLSPALPSLPLEHRPILLTPPSSLCTLNTALEVQSTEYCTQYIHHGHTSTLRLLLRDLERAVRQETALEPGASGGSVGALSTRQRQKRGFRTSWCVARRGVDNRCGHRIGRPGAASSHL